MCSVEGMIFVELYQKSIKEDIKKIQRRSVEIAAAGALSAEELRRSQEQESVNTWADEENRKILIAAGSTKVEMAGAGVDIPAIMDQWKNAVVELFGAKQSHLRKQAQVGEVRAADIVETKIARLDMLKPAGTAEWVLAAATGFAKGVQMEQAMGTWDSHVLELSYQNSQELWICPVLKRHPQPHR